MKSIISGILALVTMGVALWYFSDWIVWGFDMNLLLIKGIKWVIPFQFGSMFEVAARFFNLERILLFFEISLIWRFILAKIGL